MTTAKEITQLLAEEAKRFEEEHDRGHERTYVRIAPPREPSQVYSVRIPKNRLAQLRSLAEREGKQPTTMIREWVLQRLEEEETLQEPMAGLSSRLAGQVLLRIKQAMDEIVSHIASPTESKARTNQRTGTHAARPRKTARRTGTVERRPARKIASRKKTSAARKPAARKKTSAAKKPVARKKSSASKR